MEKAVVLSATSEAAGFPKENLLVGNPDLYWKPTSTATQVIIIDFGAAQRIDIPAAWIHNYTTNHVAGFVRTSYSSDNSTYTVWATDSMASYWTQGAPLYIGSTGLTAQTYRYWKVEFLSFTIVPEVSCIFLARKYALRANQYPEKDETIYYNHAQKAGGGRKFVTGITRNAVSILPRTWLFPSTTDMQPLIDAHVNSRGSLFPMVLRETSGIGSKLVRFSDDDLKQNKIAHQIYNPTVEFEELPHIYPGEAL
jgi:hypothetical protein